MEAEMDFKEIIKGLLQQLIISNFYTELPQVTSTHSTQYQTLV